MKVVSIYVDEAIWERILRDSLELSVRSGKRVSIGRYLTDFYMAHIEPSKVDQATFERRLKAVDKEPTADDSDKAKRIARVKKIAGVQPASEIPFTGGYSKEHQARKKGK